MHPAIIGGMVRFGKSWSGARVTVALNPLGWPPVYWGPFGAHGWTPILWRLNIWPLHICFFSREAPRRVG